MISSPGLQKKIIFSLFVIILGFTKAYSQSINVYTSFEKDFSMSKNFLSEEKIENFYLIYGSFFAKKAQQRTNYDDLRKFIEKTIPEDTYAYAVLDWEGIWYSTLAGKGDKSLRFTDVINEYIKVIRFARSIRPKIRWAYYGLPFRSNTLDKQQLVEWNKTLIKLFREQDFLAPSLYLYNNSAINFTTRTQRFINTNLEAAFEIALSLKKPVIPFVWHRWHPNSNLNPFDLIPKEKFSAYVTWVLGYKSKNQSPIGVIWYNADYKIANRNVNQLISKTERAGKGLSNQGSHAYQDFIFRTYYTFLKDYIIKQKQ